MKKRAMKKWIPNNQYCYETILAKDGGVKMCPWWSHNLKVDIQECGHCKYLGFGDWQEEHSTLLWEKVKECGVKDN